MSVWNKVLTCLIFVAAIAFFLFAARTLKTHAAWRKSVADHEDAIAKLQKANELLMDGEGDKPGIRKLEQQFGLLAGNRTRVWSGCAPQSVVPQTGAIAVAVESTSPHQILKDTSLYLFDDNEYAQGGRYLGKFTVAQVADRSVVLQPAYTLTPAEIARLQQARAPLSLHQNLPVDDNQLFADLTEAQKKAMLPPAALDEYLKDAKDEQGNWKRKLRDYGSLFTLAYRRRAGLTKQIEAATRDLQYLTKAVEGQQEQEKFLKNRLALLKDDLKTAEKERDAVVGHQKALEERSTAMKAAGDQLAKQNQAAVAQLARAQWDASQRIEERARRVAQARGAD